MKILTLAAQYFSKEALFSEIGAEIVKFPFHFHEIIFL